MRDRPSPKDCSSDDRARLQPLGLRHRVNNASLTIGAIGCSRVEEIRPPPLKARWTNKLVDELAREKRMESTLRS